MSLREIITARDSRKCLNPYYFFIYWGIKTPKKPLSARVFSPFVELYHPQEIYLKCVKKKEDDHCTNQLPFDSAWCVFFLFASCFSLPPIVFARSIDISLRIPPKKHTGTTLLPESSNRECNSSDVINSCGVALFTIAPWQHLRFYSDYFTLFWNFLRCENEQSGYDQKFNVIIYGRSNSVAVPINNLTYTFSIENC
jgi:hypothetical protein